MNAYLEILRPGNALMAVIAIFLVALVNGDFNLNVLLAALAVFMATGAGKQLKLLKER